MTMAVMGTPVSSGNRGVLALGASLVELCSEATHGGEVVLLLSHGDSEPVPFRVGGKQKLIPVVPARMSPRSRLRDHFFWILAMSILYRLLPLPGVRKAIARNTPWVKALTGVDVVGDVRGGDSFSDIYGLGSSVMGFLMAWTAVLVKGTMVQFPQTYGPYKSPVARRLASYLLKRSSVIIARDQESQAVAQELAGPGRDVLLSPDVAFALDPVRPEGAEPVPPGAIGLNVNGLMYNGGYSRRNMFGLKLDYAAFLPELISALLAEAPGELWLVPHTYAPRGDVESDNEASEKIRDSLPPELRSRVRLISAEYDQHEIKWIIGQFDFFVGSRMHACIAALSQGVPCAGVAYSRKFAGVFESVGMGAWVVDARSRDRSESIAQVVALYRQRNGVRKDLAARAAEARQKLGEVFKGLVNRMVKA